MAKRYTFSTTEAVKSCGFIGLHHGTMLLHDDQRLPGAPRGVQDCFLELRSRFSCFGRIVWPTAPYDKEIVTVTTKPDPLPPRLKNPGSIVQVYGIVTERDFLTKLVVKSGDASKLQVKDIATQDVVAVEESATVGNCMAVMVCHWHEWALAETFLTNISISNFVTSLPKCKHSARSAEKCSVIRGRLQYFEREEGSEKETLPQNIEKFLLNYTPCRIRRAFAICQLCGGPKSSKSSPSVIWYATVVHFFWLLFTYERGFELSYVP